MPSIPKPVLIIRVVVSSAAGGAWSNVHYWTPDAAFDPNTINDAAADAYTLLAPLYAACIHSSATVVGVTAEALAGSTQFMGSKSANTSGTQGGVAVSDQNCVVIRRLTGSAGAQKRGRFFISSLSGDQFEPTNPDELNAGSAGDFQSLAAAFSDQTFGGVLCHSRLWDRKDNQLLAITSMRVSSRIASRDDRRRHAVQLAL